MSYRGGGGRGGNGHSPRFGRGRAMFEHEGPVRRDGRGGGGFVPPLRPQGRRFFRQDRGGRQWNNHCQTSGNPMTEMSMFGRGPGELSAVEGEENVWMKVTTPDGNAYYFHSKTRETTWSPPDVSVPGVRVSVYEEVHGASQTPCNGVGTTSSPQYFPLNFGCPRLRSPRDDGAHAPFTPPFAVVPPPVRGFGSPPPRFGPVHPYPYGGNRHGFGCSNGSPPGPIPRFDSPLTTGGNQFSNTGSESHSAQVAPPSPKGAKITDEGVPEPMEVLVVQPNPSQLPPDVSPRFGSDVSPSNAYGSDKRDLCAQNTDRVCPPVFFPGGPMMPPCTALFPPPMFPPPPFLPGCQPLGPIGVPPPNFNAPPSWPAGMDMTVVIAKASEWSEHISPSGCPYYYSSRTNVSVWEKPIALIEFEEMQKIGAEMNNVKDEAIAETRNKRDEPPQHSQRLESPQKTNSEKKGEEQTCRAVASTPVSGTPWCVVLTANSRIFFFNPSTRLSVWNRPVQLVGRSDVDEIIKKCMEKPGTTVEKVEATSTTKTCSPQTKPEVLTEKVDDQEERTVEPEETEQENLDTFIEPPLKKSKIQFDLNLKSKTKCVDNQADKSQKLESSDDIGKRNALNATKVLDNDIEKRDALKEANASEAEARAAKERATIPAIERVKLFREMLAERQVSAFSTWEQELHKIVFDSRYLLLTSKERKTTFHDFVKERVEEEKKERRGKMKQVKANFMKFLDDVQSQYSPLRLTYNEFEHKYGRDDQFKAVEKSRDREAYFLEHFVELKELEKGGRPRIQKTKDLFSDYLAATVGDYHLRYEDVRRTFDRDSRWLILERSEKQELFRENQARLRAESKARRREERAKRRKNDVKKMENTASRIHQPVNVNGDGSAKLENESVKLEDVSDDDDGQLTEDSDDESVKHRERKLREAASMREREKEVQQSLAGSLRDREKEIEQYQHDRAVQSFQTLLTDFVKVPDIPWSYAKRIMREDQRWNNASRLPKRELDDLFYSHCDSILYKNRQQFRQLLDEIGVDLNAKWDDEIKDKIREDPRFIRFFPSDEKQREREFRRYLKIKISSMKTEFCKLLQESKMLTYKTKQQIEKNPHVMEDVQAALAKDKRYLDMESLPVDREMLLWKHIDNLAKKGAPPPPTASDPEKLKTISSDI